MSDEKELSVIDRNAWYSPFSSISSKFTDNKTCVRMDKTFRDHYGLTTSLPRQQLHYNTHIHVPDVLLILTSLLMQAACQQF